MRAVVRQPKNRVCFLLDEFAALGYLPEIETAFPTYAGFNMTVLPHPAMLIQLKGLYKDNWETFIGNATIRQYFTLNDNFSASVLVVRNRFENNALLEWAICNKTEPDYDGLALE